MNTCVCVNHRNFRDCLCKWYVDSCTVVQSHIELIRILLGRTFLCTQTTSGTKVGIYVTRFFLDSNGKVSYETAYFFYFTVRVDMNLLVLSCIHHLWCQDTCRTVQCRECLIKLCHLTADGRLFLYDIYFITCLCDIQCSLDAGNTAADYEGTFYDLALSRLQRSVQIQFCDGSFGKDDCLFCTNGFVFMYPGALLTDIGDFYHVWVKSCSFCCLTESCFMHTRRT